MCHKPFSHAAGKLGFVAWTVAPAIAPRANAFWPAAASHTHTHTHTSNTAHSSVPAPSRHELHLLRAAPAVPGGHCTIAHDLPEQPQAKAGFRQSSTAKTCSSKGAMGAPLADLESGMPNERSIVESPGQAGQTSQRTRARVLTT